MEESPYLEIKEPEGMIAGETEPPRTVAGSSNAQEAELAGAGAGSHVTENTLGAAETEAAALEDPRQTRPEQRPGILWSWILRKATGFCGRYREM